MCSVGIQNAAKVHQMSHLVQSSSKPSSSSYQLSCHGRVCYQQTSDTGQGTKFEDMFIVIFISFQYWPFVCDIAILAFASFPICSFDWKWFHLVSIAIIAAWQWLEIREWVAAISGTKLA